MSEAMRCPICNSTHTEPGVLLSTGKLHFRPEHTKFLTLTTGNIEVTAHLCLDCGHLSLMGDAEKVKNITEQKDRLHAGPGAL